METSPNLIPVLDRIKNLYQVHGFTILQKYSIIYISKTTCCFDEGYHYTVASWDYLNWSNEDLVKLPNKSSN